MSGFISVDVCGCYWSGTKSVFKPELSVKASRFRPPFAWKDTSSLDTTVGIINQAANILIKCLLVFLANFVWTDLADLGLVHCPGSLLHLFKEVLALQTGLEVALLNEFLEVFWTGIFWFKFLDHCYAWCKICLVSLVENSVDATSFPQLTPHHLCQRERWVWAACFGEYKSCCQVVLGCNSLSCSFLGGVSPNLTEYYSLYFWEAFGAQLLVKKV